MDAPSTQPGSSTTVQSPLAAQAPAKAKAELPIETAIAVSYRADLILRATRQIPLTTEGLPVAYYRVDLLPSSRPTDTKEEMECLRNAYVDLSYEHGYPTLPDGRAFWYKLDYEPSFAYGAFQIYLESLDKGPREMYLLSENAELRHLATKVYLAPQEIEALPATDKLIPKDRLHKILYEFSILYLWRQRAKSHDLYKDAAYRHLRLRRQNSVEDDHFKLAQGLKKKLLDKVINAGEDFWEGMSAKTAVDFFGKLVAIERISAGLPSQGPLSQKEQPEDMTFEMIMRTLGQKQQQGNTYENGGGSAAGASRQILTDVLGDPETAASLQEVIVRITRSTQQALPNPNDNARARSFKGRGRTNEIITTEDLIPFDITDAPGQNLDIDSEVVKT